MDRLELERGQVLDRLHVGRWEGQDDELDSHQLLLTPTAGGSFAVSIIARGSPRDVSATLPITVIASQITSSLFPSGVHVNESFNYTITATNSPFAFDVSGLPAGLSLNRSSGVISGEPNATGTFPVTVIAHTSYGDGSAVVAYRRRD